jgi:hypothetical protein
MFIAKCDVICEMIDSLITIIYKTDCVAKTILNLILRKFELRKAKLQSFKILSKLLIIIFEKQIVFQK